MRLATMQYARLEGIPPRSRLKQTPRESLAGSQKHRQHRDSHRSNRGQSIAGISLLIIKAQELYENDVPELRRLQQSTAL